MRDNEESDGDDYKTETRTTSLGLGFRKAGTSSPQRFLAKWNCDGSDSTSSMHGAESRLMGKGTTAAPCKLQRQDERSTADQQAKGQPAKAHLSQGQSSKLPTGKGKKVAKGPPSLQPCETPLDIALLNIRMPLPAARCPRRQRTFLAWPCWFVSLAGTCSLLRLSCFLQGGTDSPPDWRHPFPRRVPLRLLQRSAWPSEKATGSGSVDDNMRRFYPEGHAGGDPSSRMSQETVK